MITDYTNIIRIYSIYTMEKKQNTEDDNNYKARNVILQRSRFV